MNGSFTQKFRILSDPPVAGTPFSIILDDEKCIGCGLCVQQCPCQTLSLVPRTYSGNQEPACQYNCPSGVDVRKYMKVLADGGTYDEVWDIITDANPFPAITGMVCPHPCEGGCNRQHLDDSVNINEVERFIGEWGIKEKKSFVKPDVKSGKRVAVVGSGPSGMSCAYHLSRMGHDVTVYEADMKPGGMLRYAIPAFRLSSDLIDREYQRITDMGVTFKPGVKIGRDISLNTLMSDYNAVYVAIGTANSKKTDFPISGRVMSGLDYLRSVREGQDMPDARNVIVIGGGNTAIDVARTARRYGAEATIIYRRTRKEMPAFDKDISDAFEEGVKIQFLSAPLDITSTGNGPLKIKCTRMRLSEKDDSGRSRPLPVEGGDFYMEADLAVYALGQEVEFQGFEELFENGFPAADDAGMTKHAGVFAGGDVLTGPETVTAAIGAGKNAALSINAYLSGKKYSVPLKKEISFCNVPLYDYKNAERNLAVRPGFAERLKSMSNPVDGSLTPGQVSGESERCISCGNLKSEFTGSRSAYFGKVCLACHNCEAICPQDALTFENYYSVEKGRWSNTALRIPEKGKGYPNPFMEENPPAFKEIENKLTDTERVIYRRRSNRVFTDKEVPKEMIHRILEAGRFAPSAGNSQPWKFIVIRDRTLLDELSRDCTRTLGLVTRIYQGKGPLRTMVKNSMAFLRPDGIDQRPMVAIQALLTPQFGEKQMDIFFGATTVIYVLVHHMGISTPVFSTGMCCQNMVLTAHSLGLGTCYAGFGTEPVNMSKKLKKKLGIKWPYDLVATSIVIGYPAVQIDKPVEREFPQVDWIE